MGIAAIGAGFVFTIAVIIAVVIGIVWFIRRR